jgi:hypothetical protein
MRRIPITMPRPPSGLMMGGRTSVTLVPLNAEATGLDYTKIGVFRFLNTIL